MHGSLAHEELVYITYLCVRVVCIVCLLYQHRIHTYVLGFLLKGSGRRVTIRVSPTGLELQLVPRINACGLHVGTPNV